MSFWPAKVLLSAVELGLFTKLGAEALTGRGDCERPSVCTLARPRLPRRAGGAAVARARRRRDRQARYRNTAETALFLDRHSPHFIGGFLEMANARLYRFWGDLTEALQTGRPQNEVKHAGKSMFEELYSRPERLEQFMDAMAGISAGNFQALAEKFDFSNYQTALRRRRRHRPALDHRGRAPPAPALHALRPAGGRRRSPSGGSRPPGSRTGSAAASGDFFADPLPKADVITMGMILHDWNLEKKMHLIRAAYEALPPGGAFIAIENLIDDARRENAFGLMMSLNMLIEFGDAFDFTGRRLRRLVPGGRVPADGGDPAGRPGERGVAYK